MCLGVPGRVVDTFREHGLLMAKIDFGGIYRSVCLEHTPEAKAGDYVIVHVGFALSVIGPEEAEQVFAFLKKVNGLEELEHENSGYCEDSRQ